MKTNAITSSEEAIEKLSFDAFKLLNAGRWAVQIDPDQKPKMYADSRMCELLGISLDSTMTPEELFRFVHERIEPDYTSVLEEYMNRLIAGETPEVFYHWCHPCGRVVKVRCIGKRDFSHTTGILLKGAHSHLCDIVDVSLIRDAKILENFVEKREKEKLTETTRDRIFSEIARKLYGYTITVNLTNGTFELLVGEGSDEVAQLFSKCDRYETALELKMKVVDPTFAKALHDLISLKSLIAFSQQGKIGFVKTYKFKVHINSRKRWHETSVFIGVNECGEPVANLLGRDVTEIHMQQEREILAERKANEARKYFFSTVSHDIRTPLNAIIGYTELLKLGIDDKEQREHAIDSIVAGGQVLMDLINDVLDLSKLESGKMEIVPEPTNIKELVHETTDAFSLKCSTKKIDLIENVGDMPPLMLDPHRVRQILFNLLGNAVKFTDRGHVKVSVTWEDETFTLSVEDTGCGIAKRDHELLMTPYVQIRGSGRNGGTGLGLAICKQLASRMGGEISFDSEYGKGSTFNFVIPIVKSVETTNKKASVKTSNEKKAKNDAVAIKPESILIVDDSSLNLKVLEFMLRRIGIKDITSAPSGEKALECFKEKKFDLVLTDLWMSNMGGEALVEKIREEEKITGRNPTPVCAVTADVEAVKNETAVKFNGILLKPVILENLTSLIGSVCVSASSGGGGLQAASSVVKSRFSLL